MLLSTTALKACHLARCTHRKAIPSYTRYLSSLNTGHEECDVVIVGGGPAGLALASALGSSQYVRNNLRVTLVEAGDLTKIRNWEPKSGFFSNRVSSLTNVSQDFLKDTGAWKYVEESRTNDIEDMQVWDGISGARILFSAVELGLRQRGMSRLIENLNLQRALLRHLEFLPHIQLLQRTKVKEICSDVDEKQGWPLVHLDNGQVLRARLLVGADGFNSPVRSYAQISSFGWAYETQAIVATLCHHPRSPLENPNTIAYQRFLPTGPIAFLPLSPTSSSLVWSTKPPLAQALQACEPSVLTCMINAAFRLPELSLRYLHNRILEAHASGAPIKYAELEQEIIWRSKSHGIDQNSAYAPISADLHLDSIPPTDSEMVPPRVTSLQSGTVASFPLRFNHAEAYIGGGPAARTVLVGDAAHTVHPLAGQGLNMGLSDVECLAKCIQNTLLCGGDIGSYTALLPYAQERYLANHTLMSAIDKLHKIYSTDNGPIVWARSVGVEVINELDSIKAAMMMSAGCSSRTNLNGSWDGAARGVESLAATAAAAKVVGNAISGAIGTRIRSLLS